MPPTRQIQTGYYFTPTRHNDTYPAIDSATKSNHKGTRVFITGASRGIGPVIAASFAKAGAESIAIGARSDLSSVEKTISEAATTAGRKVPNVLKLSLDITDRGSVDRAAGEVEKTFGSLDILINNAGYLEAWKPLIESDPEDWWKTWTMNMKGTYLVTRAFMPLLLNGGPNKQLINLTSGGAHIVTPGASGYQTTKLALLRFTQFIDAEYGDKGVVAYSVHPGGVATEMGLRMPKEMHYLLQDQPGLAGDTIAYLTQEKRPWLAGRYISCQWDMPELVAKKDEIIEGDLLKVRMAL
ncbi:MAG: hypothetical protein M1835_002089 [Candelina submexicana]|nr:MAG: hypothetical protein M1835_002089 [Candelina submexicana]